MDGGYRESCSYSRLFGAVEAARFNCTGLGASNGGVDAIENYSVSQTSLESIFNSLSKSQIDPDE